MSEFRESRWKLLTAQFLAAWGDRMWQFAMTLFIIELFQHTFFYTALYGLSGNMICMMVAPCLGRLIDRYHRLKLLFSALLLENGTATITCALFYYALIVREHAGEVTTQVIALFIAIAVISPIGEAASTLSTIAIEKDWVLVISRALQDDNDEDSNLEELNSAMRRVDLICKVCSPISVGLVSNFAGIKGAIAFVGIWNAGTFFMEYLLLQRVYKAVPELERQSQDELIAAPVDYEGEEKETSDSPKDMTWIDYFQHVVFPASFSFVLLYFNLLTNGSLSTTFLRWSGVSDLFLSFFRGVAALFGIAATFVMPRLLKSHGILGPSLVMIWFFMFCLFSCFSAFLLHWNDTKLPTYGLIMFITGITISRLGLWGFDLGMTQIMQTWVRPDKIGEINGFQKAGTNVMYLLSWGFVMYFSDPAEFRWPVLASFASVVFAVLLYTYFYLRYRNERVTDDEMEQPLLTD